MRQVTGGGVGREREGLREIGMKGNVSFPGYGGEEKCYDEMSCDTQIYLKNWSLVVLVFTVRLLRKSEIWATSLLHEERGVTSTPHTHSHTHTHTHTHTHIHTHTHLIHSCSSTADTVGRSYSVHVHRYNKTSHNA